MSKDISNKVGYFCGLCSYDILYSIDFPIKKNEKYQNLKSIETVGGPATNAARTFLNLGGQAELFLVAGKDPLASWVIQQLHRYGAKINSVHTNENIVRAVCIIDKLNGDRTILGTSPPIHDKCFNSKDFTAADIILTDGYNSEAYISLIADQKEMGVPIVFDGGYWKSHHEDLLKYIDIAICSSNYKPPECNDVFKYLKKYNIPKVAVTNGGDLILWRDNEKEGKIMPPSIHPVDTLGAGDVFHGAFCFFYSQTQVFAESLALASKVASESCSHFGLDNWFSTYEK